MNVNKHWREQISARSALLCLVPQSRYLLITATRIRSHPRWEWMATRICLASDRLQSSFNVEVSGQDNSHTLRLHPAHGARDVSIGCRQPRTLG